MALAAGTSRFADVLGAVVVHVETVHRTSTGTERG